jgi:UDP-2,3-diacylglucosamine pyrophosphatase LpxH
MAARFASALLVAACVALPGGHATALQQAAAARPIVVVSDLHMGVGRGAMGSWHPYEDFRWATEFAAFLKTIDAEGRGSTDLILNGDAFELWQSTRRDCVYADAVLGCTETEALSRLERVLTAHNPEIRALGQFAGSGANHVVFVPGDHDAALLYGGVGRRVIQALGAPAGRVEVASAGLWLSADGQVYAEHGHQIGFSAYRFDNWPLPFTRRSGREHLFRSWGERIVQDFFNRYEEQYPILDNVAELGAGVKYGLAAEGISDAGDAAPQLLRILLLTMSWLQFRLDLDGGETEPPAWDLAKVRAEGPSSLIAALPDDDRFKPLAIKALADGRLARSMEELTDDQLVALCDYRAAVRRARRRMERVLTQLPGQGPAVTECPRTPATRGSAFEYFWRSRDLIFTRRLGEAAPQAARSIMVFVHGHTHLADRSQAGTNAINGSYTLVPEGFSPVRGADGPIVINGGAWQRTITPVQLDRIKADRSISDRDLLRSLQPEDLPPCYSFVQIARRGGVPVPAVRYWRRTEHGDWGVSTGCGR